MYTGPPELETNGEVTTASDMWAFGGVLLVVASWVVFGPQGVQDFTNFRCSVVKELKQNKIVNPLQTVPIADDAFHDGEHLLKEEIWAWMDTLISRVAASDTVTTQVITMVRDRLLVDDVEKRAKASEICDMWSNIEDEAKKDLHLWTKKNLSPNWDRSLDQHFAATSLGGALNIFTTECVNPAIISQWQTNGDMALNLETISEPPGRSEQPSMVQHNAAKPILPAGEYASVTVDTATALSSNSADSDPQVNVRSLDANRQDAQLALAFQHSCVEHGETFHLPIDQILIEGNANTTLTKVPNCPSLRFKDIHYIPYDIFISMWKWNESKKNRPLFHVLLPSFLNPLLGIPPKDPELASTTTDLHNRHFVSHL
jgi:hypothetical protein